MNKAFLTHDKLRSRPYAISAAFRLIVVTRIPAYSSLWLFTIFLCAKTDPTANPDASIWTINSR